MYFLHVLLLVAASQGLSSARSIGEADDVGLVKRGELDALAYLEKAGYLDDLDDKHRMHAPDNVKQALKEFQEYSGLTVTGRLDKDTVAQMKKPRCGVPDVIKPSQRPKDDPDAPLDYLFTGKRWNNKALTYKFNSYSRKLAQSSQRKSIADALSMWSAVTPLTFTRYDYGRVDMDIMFASRAHGDNNPFDGPGRVLAHAFHPGNAAISGDLHFDADEPWIASGNYGGTSLESVAAHEFGHSLGLGHSQDQGALMYAFYSGHVPRLGTDDINGIQKLYGSKGWNGK